MVEEGDDEDDGVVEYHTCFDSYWEASPKIAMEGVVLLKMPYVEVTCLVEHIEVDIRFQVPYYRAWNHVSPFH